jgi:prophage tail gpP-like protein
MLNMAHDIYVGGYKIGMLDKVSIHSSVELLADTASIVLPASEYGKALEVESKLKRGDQVSIGIGYTEYGILEEFKGWLQAIRTDDGSITLECEDDLFLFRKDLANIQFKSITIKSLLNHIIKGCGLSYKLDCSYEWTYTKFTINAATGFDVLKKVQEECGADIYLKNGTLHVHAPAEKVGKNRRYDFAQNIEKSDLKYRTSADRKIRIVVKALLPDGKVRKIESGTTGGDKKEIMCATSDITSMKRRGEIEAKRLSYDGYEGSFDTWLVPVAEAGDSAILHDADYPEKDGKYFITSVTTEFGALGGSRKIEVGIKLN